MAQLCLIIAGCGLALSAVLYIAIKRRWRIADPLCRYAPRIATISAALLLLMFVMMATAETSNLADALGKGLKQAEYTLRDWFNNLKFSSG
jgi:hypothetical protein